MSRSISAGNVRIGGRNPLVLIAGPCVIEGEKKCLSVAVKLEAFAREEKVPLIFKASYDKANRTSYRSWRGPGMAGGLEILEKVRARTGLPVLTDVHSEAEVGPVSRVADVIQIPAFLCRQTDLLTAAGESGLPVNIKKGQFLSPEEMEHAVAKVERTGNRKIMVTERGTCFGYNNLVADMRSLPVLRKLGYPVVFDATHSVQRPGGEGGASGGDGAMAPVLARAAVAAGCDGVFMEVHPKPAEALSDGANSIALRRLRGLWRQLKKIDEIPA
ncbi:MAG: 3-deoxy-8-phosphooctulonate synthase [Kiritimatiellia bacterium]